MTLADLKRDLKNGTKIVLIHPNTNKLIGIERYIIKTQTNSVSISPDKEAVKGSWLELPKAKLMEYYRDDKRQVNILHIYEPGYRDLTDEENRILTQRPSSLPENFEDVRHEMLTDGSRFYWLDKKYFQDIDMEYLEGHKMIRGLRYDFNKQMIKDENIKGDLVLSYEIYA
jgi:hypothetical protein